MKKVSKVVLDPALGWNNLVDDILESNELIKPFDISYRSDKGYFLLTRETSPIKVGVIDFRDWVFNELGKA
ncbi:MAG: hypothetical protein ACI8P9_002604 [Parasphingorhabdus sp.]